MIHNDNPANLIKEQTLKDKIKRTYKSDGGILSQVTNKTAYTEDVEKKILENYINTSTKHNADPDRRFDMFNGNVLVSYFNKDDGSWNVQPSKFSEYLAGQKNILPSGIVLSGTASLLITSDGYIIFGSRDISRDKNDSDKYLLQFPCGFHDSDNKQIEELKSLQRAKYPFSDFASSEGKRELDEELCELTNKEIKLLNPAGFVTLETDGKEMLGTYFSAYHTSLSLSDIIKLRSINPPKDQWEMTKIGGIHLSDVVNILNNGNQIFFDNRKREFAGQLGDGVELTYEAIKDNITQDTLANRVKNNRVKEIEDNNNEQGNNFWRNKAKNKEKTTDIYK